MRCSQRLACLMMALFASLIAVDTYADDCNDNHVVDRAEIEPYDDAGHALWFDGQGDAAVILGGDGLDFSDGDAITLEMLVFLPAYPTEPQVLYSRGDAEDLHFQVTVEGPFGKVHIGFEDEDGSWHEYEQTGNPSILPNRWVRVAIAHEFGDASSTRMYFDTKQVGGQWTDGSDGSALPRQSAGISAIGARFLDASSGSLEMEFNGSISDLRLWGRLPDTPGFFFGFDDDDPTLIADYALREGTGVFVHDTSPNGNEPGVLAGKPIWFEQVGDCDSNFVPDFCDPDCDGNGRPDGCDIADGLAEDCNRNGVPDLCDPFASNVVRVPVDVPTIHEAIEMVCVGGEVIIEPGVYAGPIDLQGKALTLRSTDPSNPAVVEATRLSGMEPGHTLTGFSNGGETFVNGLTLCDGDNEDGGAVFVEYVDAPVWFRRCLFQNNTGFRGGAVRTVDSDVRFEDCRFEGNQGFFGGAVNGLAAYARCTFIGNSASSSGGAIVNLGSSHISDCNFVGNNAVNYGGAVYNVFAFTRPTVINCVFRGNTALSGGAITNNFEARLTAVNSVFVGNSATLIGGAITSYENSITYISSCSVTANLAKLSGSAVASASASETTVSNSILWQNHPEPFASFGGAFAIEYCLIEGGAAGDGNIDADPLFHVTPTAGPDGTWGSDDDILGDLRPAAASPAIDAGSNEHLPEDTTDLDGDGDVLESVPLDLGRRVRVIDASGSGVPSIDIGAYERQPDCPADVNEDLLVDIFDLIAIISDWGASGSPNDVNGDGTVGIDDLLEAIGAWGSICG